MAVSQLLENGNWSVLKNKVGAWFCTPSGLYPQDGDLIELNGFNMVWDESNLALPSAVFQNSSGGTITLANNANITWATKLSQLYSGALNNLLTVAAGQTLNLTGDYSGNNTLSNSNCIRVTGGTLNLTGNGTKTGVGPGASLISTAGASIVHVAGNIQVDGTGIGISVGQSGSGSFLYDNGNITISGGGRGVSVGLTDGNATIDGNIYLGHTSSIGVTVSYGGKIIVTGNIVGSPSGVNGTAINGGLYGTAIRVLGTVSGRIVHEYSGTIELVGPAYISNMTLARGAFLITQNDIAQLGTVTIGANGDGGVWIRRNGHTVVTLPVPPASIRILEVPAVADVKDGVDYWNTLSGDLLSGSIPYSGVKTGGGL